MIADVVSSTLLRNLETLRGQIQGYAEESDVWRRVPGIANPAGNLTLHLCGNLQHFVGGVLGGSGFVRDRDAEFSTRQVPRSELVGRIDATSAAVQAALAGKSDQELMADYPLPLAGSKVKTVDFLVHLVAHLGYHLGQVDYHRRLVAGDTRAIPAPPMSALHSARPAA